MILLEELRVTITRVRAGEKLDNNSPVADWDNPDRAPIEHALVQQSSTDEDRDRAETRIARYRVEVPDRHADIKGTDRLELPADLDPEGRQWRVIGEPLRQGSLTGIGYLAFQIEHVN